MGLFSDWFGGEKSSREVRHLRLTLEALEGGEIVQGQLAQLKLTVKASGGEPVRVHHLQFDLLNRRVERRSLLERLVTQSRFVFRFNLERDLAAGEEITRTIEFLPPICREGTRRTRFVEITWEVVPRLVCTAAGSDLNGVEPWQLVGTRFELEIHGRR